MRHVQECLLHCTGTLALATSSAGISNVLPTALLQPLFQPAGASCVEPYSSSALTFQSVARLMADKVLSIRIDNRALGDSRAVSMIRELRQLGVMRLYFLTATNVARLTELLSVMPNLVGLHCHASRLSLDASTQLLDALASRGAWGAAPLRQLTLEGLKLSQPSTASSLGRVLLAPQLSAGLHELHLCGCGLTEKSMPVLCTEALALCSSLRVLRLHDMPFLGDAAATAMAEALISNVHLATALQDLALSGSDMQDDGLVNLATALPSLFNLTSLDLSHNEISQHAATALAAVLPHCTALRRLNLMECTIGSAGMSRVLEAAQASIMLEELRVDHNPLGTAVGRAWCRFLHNPPRMLSVLTMSTTSFDGVAWTPQLAQALGSSPSLRQLDLSSNRIGPHGATALAEALTGCSGKLWSAVARSPWHDSVPPLNGTDSVPPLHTTAAASQLLPCAASSSAAPSLRELKVLRLGANRLLALGAWVLTEALEWRCDSLMLHDVDLSNNLLGHDHAAIVQRLAQRVVVLNCSNAEEGLVLDAANQV